MIVTNYPNKLTSKKTTLILGSFESFHMGHLSLIEKAKEFKKPIVVMLFENPSALPGASKKEYQPLDIRIQNLSDLGIEFAMVVKFGTKVSSLKGKTFLDKIIKLTGAVNLISGEDFALGKGRDLKAKDIPNINIVKAYKSKSGKKISTSLLKELLPLGEVLLLKKLATSPYKNRFQIRPDNTFTFKDSIALHTGVYATFTLVNDIRYWSYVEIGIDTKPVLTVPQLKLTNQPYEAIIEFHNLTKIIVKKSENKTTEKDIEKVVKVLSNI